MPININLKYDEEYFILFSKFKGSTSYLTFTKIKIIYDNQYFIYQLKGGQWSEPTSFRALSIHYNIRSKSIADNSIDFYKNIKEDYENFYSRKEKKLINFMKQMEERYPYLLI